MKSRNPYEAAKRHARNTFYLGGSVGDCPYKGKAWVTVWVTELNSMQQRKLKL